ncbi:MAG TPA: cupin domain-containing protein [Rhizomicrobium sp.]|jgi:quercetin dioxygenase-like cupin family protein
MKLRFAFLSLALATSATAADAPAPVVAAIATTTTTISGQPIVVPANPEVRVNTVTLAPGSRLPVHKHLYPHYVYVLEGTLSVTNVETGKSFDLKQGSFFAEMIGTWHYGENKGPGLLELLSIDQVPVGTKTNMVVR